MAKDWQVVGAVASAPFTLKLHRGEGMVMLAMDWKGGEPPNDFVGFSIEYRPPGAAGFNAVRNRIHFPGRSTPPAPGKPAERYKSTEAPFQTFRWVHLPAIQIPPGVFEYRVTPKFMKADRSLRSEDAQTAKVSLLRETMPGSFNIAFTRGYVSSQAFVDNFGGAEGFKKLIPPNADDGPNFKTTHDKADDAYRWMGFEARDRLLDLLDRAIADGADVMVVAYELNLPELIDRLAKLGSKLRIILDDSSTTKKKADGTKVVKDKGAPHSAESRAGAKLAAAGATVRRQHMRSLQHNKMIVVDGPAVKSVVLGSTNFSWRGLFVQSNNMLLVEGAAIVAQQRQAFDGYWDHAPTFQSLTSANWKSLQVPGLDADISMSPHSSANSTQKGSATAIDGATASLFYSLAFLYQTSGDVTKAIERATNRTDLFVYGISEKKTGFKLFQPDGNPATVSAASLGAGLPQPFRSEASGGTGVKMHHKFIVIDFDKPTAMTFTGSYNFSNPADKDNGENLVRIKGEKVATAYMVEAVRIFDTYQFRLAMKSAKMKGETKELKLPPSKPGDIPWWKKFYTDPVRIRDRKLFA
jgi:phosphatidylserine/phosphatidylglycerophosphate/cardiolipin synthase-like enzyme